MLIDVILAKNESFLNQLRSAHADSITSHNKLFDNTDPENPVPIELESEDKSAFFESIEANIKKVEAAIYKRIGFSKGDYEYAPPAAKRMAPVTSNHIKSNLMRLKNEIETFADKLKAENYRMIDGNKNESHTLTSVEKGVFKKIIFGIEQLAELY